MVKYIFQVVINRFKPVDLGIFGKYQDQTDGLKALWNLVVKMTGLGKNVTNGIQTETQPEDVQVFGFFSGQMQKPVMEIHLRAGTDGGENCQGLNFIFYELH